MKYIMMMNVPGGDRGPGDYQIKDWAPEDFKAHMEFMHRFNKKLKAAGEFVGAEGLAPPNQTRVVRAGANGAPVVTDGPFAEGKEFLAGYWIIDVESETRAFEVAAEASTAPGPGGKPLNMKIELRPVLSGLPVD